LVTDGPRNGIPAIHWLADTTRSGTDLSPRGGKPPGGYRHIGTTWRTGTRARDEPARVRRRGGGSTRGGRASDQARERGGARGESVRGHGGARTGSSVRRRGLVRWGQVRAAPVQQGRKEGRGSPKRSVETLAPHSDPLTSGGGRMSLRRCARGGYLSQGSNRLWAQVPVVVFMGVPWGWAPPGGGTRRSSRGARGKGISSRGACAAFKLRGLGGASFLRATRKRRSSRGARWTRQTGRQDGRGWGSPGTEARR